MSVKLFPSPVGIKQNSHSNDQGLYILANITTHSVATDGSNNQMQWNPKGI